jgi:7-cyano-7-deazaguanine reductase
MNLLGKKIPAPENYTPEILVRIEREIGRKELHYSNQNNGEDLWTCYELSWLKPNGIPVFEIFTFRYNQNSKYIIESKSLKLYLNSFNNTTFANKEAVRHIIETDLEDLLETKVKVNFVTEPDSRVLHLKSAFRSIDHFDLNINSYEYNPSFLTQKPINETQRLKSNLLRSNCPVTNQPDFGSIYIAITGTRGINEESFLKYLISLRNHQEFHEQCVERILSDLQNLLNDKSEITVYARYTRRGGIDINPLRYNHQANETVSNLFINNIEGVGIELQQ